MGRNTSAILLGFLLIGVTLVAVILWVPIAWIRVIYSLPEVIQGLRGHQVTSEIFCRDFFITMVIKIERDL